jgi:hypothetical protein
MKKEVSSPGTRFDKFTPQHINDERNKPEPKFSLPRVNKRFCESCKRYVDFANNPNKIVKRFKGWKCLDCKNKGDKL